MKRKTAFNHKTPFISGVALFFAAIAFVALSVFYMHVILHAIVSL